MLDVNDPNTSLKELPPIELVQVDEPGEEPPPEWGQNGQGGDFDGE
jgi:hypothetical protein